MTHLPEGTTSENSDIELVKHEVINENIFDLKLRAELEADEEMTDILKQLNKV